jgi:hypothetical protein
MRRYPLKELLGMTLDLGNMSSGFDLIPKVRRQAMGKIAQLLLNPVIVGLCVALGPSTHVVSAPSDAAWKEFFVPDFGTRVEYPAGIFSVLEGNSDVGVGKRLTTADGRASLTIYSWANKTGETPASYLRKNLRMPHSAMDYERVAPSFFAISSVTRGTILYSRCNFSTRPAPTIHCFDLTYPAQEKTAWDGIVTRISLSLRPLHG